MRIAALDLGSNSFHLVVAEAHPDGSFDVVARDKDVLRLGDQVARTGAIGADATARAVDAVRRMAAVVTRLEVDEVVVCATSAFREATDGAELCDAIYDETGLTVEVIGGRREAGLIFKAVRRSIAIDRPPAVCLDLGGGSLEVSVGDAGGLAWSTSLHLGVGRLATTFLSSDPPSDAELERLRRHVVEETAPTIEAVAAYEPRMVIATSGTLVDLAVIAHALREGQLPASRNQLTVTRADVVAAFDRLVAVPSAKRLRIPGVEDRRVDQLPAGAVLLLTMLDALRQEELTVGEWALREGMIIEAIERHDMADWSADPEEVRRSSVLALARRCDYDEAHAAAVSKLAGTLFDQTLPLHGLSPRSRSLLEYGALLHDIGEHVAVDDHHRHSAYLIQHGRLKGFEPEEIDVLAVLGRFHRRGGPSSSFDPWRRLDRQRRNETSTLLALLRVADGLDRSHSSGIGEIDVVIEPDVVQLRLVAAADADLEIWGARRKRALLEEVFERRLEIGVASPDDQPKRPVM